MADQEKEFFTEIKNEFKDLGSKVNKVFDELVRGKSEANAYRMQTDAYETKESYVYEFDLPGVVKSDVSLQIRDNQLVIKGERRRAVEGEITFHVREREFGKFERSFTIPAGVDQAKIKAKFDNGILTVTLPKEVVEAESTPIDIL